MEQIRYIGIFFVKIMLIFTLITYSQSYIANIIDELIFHSSFKDHDLYKFADLLSFGISLILAAICFRILFLRDPKPAQHVYLNTETSPQDPPAST